MVRDIVCYDIVGQESVKEGFAWRLMYNPVQNNPIFFIWIFDVSI